MWVTNGAGCSSSVWIPTQTGSLGAMVEDADFKLDRVSVFRVGDGTLQTAALSLLFMNSLL